MRKLIIILACTVFCLSASVKPLFADEGMWLINLLDKNLARQMKKAGLKLSPGEIFNENAMSLSDAVVSLDFGCTGSMISQEGLLITNHHCAYADIYAQSTPEHNYLEEGYWAMNSSEEIPIPGKNAYFLRRAFDVTEEVRQVSDSLAALGHRNRGMGGRKLYFLMEKRYQERTGMDCQCVAMWRGSKYYMFCYDVYSDLRLVGAPPVSIAAFGGETDNWEWPQHKGDFALYRVYADAQGRPAPYSPDNKPLVPSRSLTISTQGMKEGSFSMIIGYPGRTNRYNSSFGVEHLQNVEYPVFVDLQRQHLDVIKKWMEIDPEIRLKYADVFFGISNVQELRSGEIKSFGRYGIGNVKRMEERHMQRWIDSNPNRRKRWGKLLPQMDTVYSSSAQIHKHLACYRSSLITSQFLTQCRRANSLHNEWKRNGLDSVCIEDKEFKYFFNNMLDAYGSYDPRVEKEWLDIAMAAFFNNVPKEYWGDYLRNLYQEYNGDVLAMENYIWKNSIFASEEAFRKHFSTKQKTAEVFEDPGFQTAQSIHMIAFNNAIAQAEGRWSADSLNSEYGRVLYQMRLDGGLVQYPDANSTMRLTYGSVSTLVPMDGLLASWYTTSQGLWDKYNPADYEFNIKERMQSLLKEQNWGRWADKRDGKMHVNFLTNLDITGGNSGSPVFNGKGELIGLAFDGNKESLGSDAYFDKDLNKCVCVDIRYVMWIIQYYAKADYLLKEMSFK